MAYEELIRCIARRGSLSVFSQEAYKLLGNPLMITDETFYVLAYYPENLPDDYVWREIITRSYSPMEFVVQTDINDYWNRIKMTQYPMFVDEKAFRGMRRRVVSSIFVGSSVVGYLTVLEDEKTITDECLDQIRVVSELLSIYFRETNIRAESFGQMKNEFTSGLLKRTMREKEMIETRAAYLEIRFYKYHRVIAVRNNNKEDPIGRFDELRHLFLNWFATCIYSKSDNIAYYIVSYDRDIFHKKEFEENLQDLLEHEQMICIISSPTEDVLKIADCYDQVRRMAEYIRRAGIRKQPSILYYQYDRVYPDAAVIPDDPVSDILQKLEESDARYHTEYIRTLQAFFAANQNVSRCAEIMNLHRNTVNYRLDRIRDLLDEDFDDYRIRLVLQLTIMKRNKEI